MAREFGNERYSNVKSVSGTTKHDAPIAVSMVQEMRSLMQNLSDLHPPALLSSHVAKRPQH